MREAVIVGLDPGTTIGIAVLDLHGTVLTLTSSRNISRDRVITIITERGKPIIIATDKKNVPEYVRIVAAQLNAHVYSPKEDLQREEKRAVTKSYLFSNDHELDSLAAALLAFRYSQPLFIRVDQALREQQKLHLSNDVKSYLVCFPQASISLALEHRESKDQYHKNRLQRVVEKQQLPQDIAYFERKLNEVRRENFLLKEDKVSLYKRLQELNNELRALRNKEDETSAMVEKRLSQKKKLLKYLQNKLHHQSKKIRSLSEECEKLHFGILHFDEIVVCKRLSSLGDIDTSQINVHDIVLVDNLTIVSEKTRELLQSKIQIILYKGVLPRSLQKWPFHFISSQDLKIIEFREFALCDKEDYRRKKSSLDYLKIALQEFENERSKNR